MTRITQIQHPDSGAIYIVRAEGKEWLNAYGPVKDTPVFHLDDAQLDQLITDADAVFNTAGCARELKAAWTRHDNENSIRRAKRFG